MAMKKAAKGAGKELAPATSGKDSAPSKPYPKVGTVVGTPPEGKDFATSPASAAHAPGGSNDPIEIDDVLHCIQRFLLWSRNPRRDWRRIQRIVEDGLPTPSVTPPASKGEIDMPKFKDELPPNSGHRAGAVEAWPAISPQLDRLLSTILDDPHAWLATPSAQFGGKRPGDLIGTDQEQRVIDLLVAADQGMF